ncbi:MAG: hypothetical protein JWN67_2449 [Actinomycetia bacterium]|nr:hypothetical protein [Actinomycetes bacterium]
MSAPVAPWALQGESLVALARCPTSTGPLPAGMRRLPGPALVVANRYTDSPVGAYLELAVGCPARLGIRPGWCFTTMVVDNADARKGGQLNWGFPKELGKLLWVQDGDERELRWVDRDLCVRGVPGRFVLPFLVPMRSLQHRADGPVVVPARLRGRARPASVTVYAPQDDPLAGLAGTHRGVHIASMKFVVRPARHPVGFASTLLAPLRAPEPALVSSAPGD